MIEEREKCLECNGDVLREDDGSWRCTSCGWDSNKAMGRMRFLRLADRVIALIGSKTTFDEETRREVAELIMKGGE